MAVHGTLIGSFTVIITGMDLDAMTLPEWQRAIGTVARNLQNRVARSFAAQKTAGSSALKANSPRYTAAKVAAGLDPRRGHRTNMLQGVLNGAKLTMFNITVQTPQSAAARIVMEEQMLHALVPYSVYYEEKKVRTEGILALAASWVREEVTKLRSREMAAKAKRIKFSQNIIKVNIAARRANANAIINKIPNRSGQDLLRTNIEARRARALKIIGRIG